LKIGKFRDLGLKKAEKKAAFKLGITWQDRMTNDEVLHQVSPFVDVTS
jgi:hypothetical protein